MVRVAGFVGLLRAVTAGRGAERGDRIVQSGGGGDHSVSMLHVRINMIKCVFSPGCTPDVMVEFGENRLTTIVLTACSKYYC